MVPQIQIPKGPLVGVYPSLGFRVFYSFSLPPYNPRGERMAAISWNSISFCFAIFLFLFP
jgi:hypothetical protein